MAYPLNSNADIIGFATRNVVSLHSRESISKAARIMAEMRISSIVVTDRAGRPEGIVTERDILTAMQQAYPGEEPISKVMSSPIVIVPQSMNTLEAYQLCLRKGIRHLVIVDEQESLAGIVSETDFRLHMNLSVLAGYRLIASAMTRSVLAMAPQSGLREVLNLMRSHRDGCVVAVEDGVPLGILTERDVVRLYSENPDRARLGEVMTTPVLTVSIGDSINAAAGRMIEGGVRHLVVVDDDGHLAGLISEHDLTQAMALGLNEEKAVSDGAFLNTLINTIPDLVWLKDRDGVYLACNARFESYFGKKEKDIVGQSVYDFLDCERADLYHGRDCMVIESGRASVDEEWLTFAEDGYRGLFETVRTPMRDSLGELIGVLGVARDITERKRAEESLRLTASVFDNSQEGIVITDAENRIIDVNPAFSRITGYAKEEAIGRNPSLLRSGRHPPSFYAELWHALENEGAWRGEIWNRRKSGEVYAELLSISVMHDENGKTRRHVAIFSDISRSKAYEEELARIAHYDALTGIPNRVLLADRMKQAMAQTVREGHVMAVCYIDLDGFKSVNDTLGHEAGDQVLIEMAHRIGNTIRGGDTVARLGGDEFVVLLSGLEQGEECVTTLERLLATIVQPVSAKKSMLVLGASIGVCLYPLDDEDPDTLLRHADQAMYVAKQSGKNRFHLYDPEMDLRAHSHNEFVGSIRCGLEQEEFDLFYQPKIDLRTQELIGAEALIRWRHPERGLLLPAEFLHPIENSEIDIDMGDWVITSALEQLDKWRRGGLDIEVSVNISAHHLESSSFVERLRKQLAKYPDIPPGRLQIEVLETAALADLVRVNEVIGACRKFGVSFALDDFGTGYSSLSYLRNLPVDVLKIDQSFVRNMLEDRGDMAIVQGVIALAGAFNRQTVAEGIETMEHYQILLDMGCDVGQGFGIARPMQADELTNWIIGQIAFDGDTLKRHL